MHPGEVALVGAVALVLLPAWLAARQVVSLPSSAWRRTRAPRWAVLVMVWSLPVLGPVLWWRWLRPRAREGPAGD